MSVPEDILAKNWIREVRESLDLTQEQLAEKIGVEGNRTIAKWEGGARAEPRFTYVRRIAALAPWPLQMVFLGKQPSVIAPVKNGGRLPAELVAGVYLVKYLESRQVAEALDRIEDEGVRSRARSAAMAAIDTIRFPLELSADEAEPHSAQK